jgi:hypothetical protein
VHLEWRCTQEFWHGTAIITLHSAAATTASIMAWHGEYKQKHFVPAHQAIVQASPAAINKRPYPIAVWSFDEFCPDGSVTDESGGGHSLGLTNGASCAQGLIQGAAIFDGVDDIAETVNGV